VTETTDLFSGSSEPSSTNETIAADAAAEHGRTSGSAGTSLEQSGTVRSWVGGQDAEAAQGTPGAQRLATMLMPELQRLAQSLGITGTGRMRKGQVIAAIEERQQRANSAGANNPGANNPGGNTQGELYESGKKIKELKRKKIIGERIDKGMEVKKIEKKK